MNQKQIINELVDELYKSHTGKSEIGFSFGTGRNKKQCGLNFKIESCIRNLSQLMFDNLNQTEIGIDQDKYKKLITQSIIDLFTEGKFSNDFESGKLNLKIMKEDLNQKLALIRKEYTHHFPANTILIEIGTSISIGPVSIMNKYDWIQTVDYYDYVKNQFHDQKEENFTWREILIECLKNKESKINGLASDVFPILETCNTLVSVEVKGKEQQLSKKFAHILAKSSLDMISLLIGGERIFFQQVLDDERLGPSMTYSLSSVNGYLNLRGQSLGMQCGPILSSIQHQNSFMNLLEEYRPIFSHILMGLEKNTVNSHPTLTMKWIFALNWYAEGMRESNDAIALAKLASCLDTLSSSGKLDGIKELIRNFLNCEDETILFDKDGVNPITLHYFVKRFYNDGRSRILHGTLESMLESFENDRKRLAELARIILLKSASKLFTYKEVDSETAFRTMGRE